MLTEESPEFLGWGMVFIHDVQKIMELTRTRELRLRDSAVFFALISQADWKTGQIHVTQAELADMTELCRYRRGWRLLGSAINPYVVGFGKERERGHLWSKFQEA